MTKNERRNARYHWAMTQGVKATIASRASQSIAALMRAFPDADIPAELVTRQKLGGRWLIGPRTKQGDLCARRYHELRKLGASATESGPAATSEMCFLRLKRKLKGVFK